MKLAAFADHVADTGCLVWQGAQTAKGYGTLRVDGRTQYAHRVAWELVNGPIPDGMTVDHICRVRCCVRVEHLQLIERGPHASQDNRRRHALARAG